MDLNQCLEYSVGASAKIHALRKILERTLGKCEVLKIIFSEGNMLTSPRSAKGSVTPVPIKGSTNESRMGICSVSQYLSEQSLQQEEALFSPKAIGQEALPVSHCQISTSLFLGIADFFPCELIKSGGIPGEIQDSTGGG